MSCLAPRESRSDPRGPSRTHPRRGSGVLSPETRDQLLRLVPRSPCHLTGPLPLPSCVVLGQLLTCFPSAVSGAACPWPPGGSSRRRLAWPRAALLTGLCWLCSARTALHSGRRPGGAAGVLPAAHNLLSLAAGAGGSLGAMLRGSSPGGTAQGSVVLRLGPAAAASFELPTPLWSLYMPPRRKL